VTRRQFLGVLVGTAAWPLHARAQPAERMRRIGVIMAIEGDDPQIEKRLGALYRGLRQRGWVDGRNIRIDVRSGAGPGKLRENIAELIALAPDVMLSAGAASLAPLLQGTRSIPIVFANVADSVGAGFIDSLAQPGGNATGFLQAEYSLSGKLAELLKEIVPDV
jgi:putative ABC transport system substrate-binding protein